jgi:hypothetical protein
MGIVSLLSFGNNSLAGADEILFPDIRLMGAELVDEMVYQWLKDPPVTNPTAVVLADVSAPVGLDSRFNDLIENRIYELFQKNPQLQLSLVHCASCLQYVAVSNPSKTVIRRGIDQPEALAGILKMAPHTLGIAMNFESQGRELILHAHIFELVPPQKIVWAKRFSTNMGVRQSLREAAPLMSLETARKMQNEIIQGKDRLKFVTRMQIHTFESQNPSYTIMPLIFAEQSIEGESLPQRNQRFGLSAGITSIRDSYSGWTLGGHYSRLMLRDTPSLIHPDLYWFFGVDYMRLQGVGASVFAENQLDIAKLLKDNEDPKASLTAYHYGFEVFVKYRFGLSVYLEYIPALDNSKIIAKENFLLPYHGVGTAMVFQW